MDPIARRKDGNMKKLKDLVTAIYEEPRKIPCAGSEYVW